MRFRRTRNKRRFNSKRRGRRSFKRRGRTGRPLRIGLRM